MPGPDAYAAIKALEAEHPEPGYRRWMAVRARERKLIAAQSLRMGDEGRERWNVAP